MDKENKSKTFCSECGKEKTAKFCNNCGKETHNLYKENPVVTIRSEVSASVGVKRGDISWAYFPIAYGILLTLSVGIIQLFEIISWYFRIILIIVVSLIFFYLCFFNGRFRNFIVKIFTSSKEFIERF
jgi:hypothetical protein